MEVDRQHIRRRIAKLRRELKTLARTRETKRSRRQRSGIPQVAIAGYTNAGKSTLMNRAHGRRRRGGRPAVRHARPDRAPAGAPRRAPVHDHRHRRVREQAAARPRGGVPLDARGGDARGAHRARRRRGLADLDGPDRGRAQGARRDRRRRDPRGAGAQQDRPGARVRARAARSPVPGLRGRLGADRRGRRGIARDARGDAAAPAGRGGAARALRAGGRDRRCSIARPRCCRTTPRKTGTIVHARVGLRELAAVRGFVRSERRTGSRPV